MREEERRREKGERCWSGSRPVAAEEGEKERMERGIKEAAVARG